jgi:hypothetical protein
MNAYDLGDEGIGFALSLDALRDVLKGLNIRGRKWWIACDPDDVLALEWVTVGHGDPLCQDRLNTIYFRIPVVNATSAARPDQLILCFSSGAISCQDPGFYQDGDNIVQDLLEDFTAFFHPVKKALVARMQAEDEDTPGSAGSPVPGLGAGDSKQMNT